MALHAEFFMPTIISTTIAILCGLFAAYVDSRPNWDDTGTLVAGLLLTSGIISFAQPRRPWLHAGAIGGFMPLWSIARGAGIAPAVALIFTFIGAYAGSFTRHAIRYNAPP